MTGKGQRYRVGWNTLQEFHPMTLIATQPQPPTGTPTVPAANPKPIPKLDPSLVRLETEAIAMRDYYQSGGRY